MHDVLVFATVISPIIMGLVQMVKQTTSIPVNYIPWLAILIGLFVGFSAQPFTELDLVLRLWAGGLAGLSATGLFELVNDRSKNETK